MSIARLASLALLAIALSWSNARAEPARFVIEAEVLPERIYVGAESRLRLRLLRAPGASFGSLRPPVLGDAADLRPLGPYRSYEVAREGATWQVRERAYAIVPHRAGNLVIPGAELEGPLRYAEDSGRDGRPLLAAGDGRGPRRTLEVLAPPPGAGEPWLPARRVTLEESWSHDLEALAAGVPLTRTVVLRVEGIAADRLPAIAMAAQPSLAVHHDLPDMVTEYLEAGTTGHRVQRIVLMPLAEGTIELPVLSVRWWDVAADAPRTASLAPRSLRAGAALVPEAPPGTSPEVSGRAVTRWFAMIVMLVSAALLWRHVRSQPLREARRQLREACRTGNAPAAREALIEWWRAAAPAAPVPLVRRMGDAWPDPAGQELLRSLDAALYAGHPWDGAAFWRGARPLLRRWTAKTRSAPRRQALPPLYKLQDLGRESPQR